jgi:glycosyltransferase involved in cell wall biosynthesis
MTTPFYRIIGLVGGSYSLAAVNRDLALALARSNPGRVRLELPPGVSWRNWLAVPRAQRSALWRLAVPCWRSGPEVAISQHYPLHVPRRRGDACLCYFFWEESLVPEQTVAALNRSFDAVLAPTRYVADALLRSGLTIPAHIVGLAPDLAPFFRVRRRPGQGIVRFLHVSSAFPRKGVDLLLRAYAMAFTAADPVELTIKTFPNPHNRAADQIAALRIAVPDAPAIRLIDGDIPREAMFDLYRDADAMVLPTRGEGFNLPAAEAMAAGVPLIVSESGGQADFCTPRNARLLPCRLAPSRSHLARPGSQWFEPDLGALAQALREIAAGGPDIAERAERARADVAEMTPGRLAARIDAAVGTVLARKQDGQGELATRDA